MDMDESELGKVRTELQHMCNIMWSDMFLCV